MAESKRPANKCWRYFIAVCFITSIVVVLTTENSSAACKPGWVPARSPNSCWPIGAVECGIGHYCNSGFYCAAAKDSCVRNGWIECSATRTCPAGYQCAPNGCSPGPQRKAAMRAERRNALRAQIAGNPCNRASGGAMMHYYCHSGSPAYRSNSYADTIRVQAVSRQAQDLCRSASDMARCVQLAKVGIIFNGSPDIRRRCGNSTDAIKCVDEAMTWKEDTEALRERLRRSISTAPEKIEEPAAPPPTPPGNVLSRLFSRAPPEESSLKGDGAYCNFVAYRVRSDDGYYRSIDKVPAECRDSDDIRSHFNKRASPIFTMDASQTEIEIRRLTKQLNEELAAQLAPGPDNPNAPSSSAPAR